MQTLSLFCTSSRPTVWTHRASYSPGVERSGLSVHHQLHLAPRLTDETVPFCCFCGRIFANLRENKINCSQSVSNSIKLEVSRLRCYAVWTGKYRRCVEAQCLLLQKLSVQKERLLLLEFAEYFSINEYRCENLLHLTVLNLTSTYVYESTRCTKFL